MYVASRARALGLLENLLTFFADGSAEGFSVLADGGRDCSREDFVADVGIQFIGVHAASAHEDRRVSTSRLRRFLLFLTEPVLTVHLKSTDSVDLVLASQTNV